MSNKLIPVALTILSGTALSWAVACSSSSSGTAADGGGASSSSSGGGSDSGGSSSSGGGSSSGSGSSGGGIHDSGSEAGPGPCVGTAGSVTLIDNETAPTGTGISLAPPTGAVQGSWFEYTATGGTIGNPPNAPSATAPSFTYSPLPMGIPAEAGAPASGGGDGGGPNAACISGATGTAQYSTEGMGFNLAVSPNPDGGAGTPYPINASCHMGIQFWAWGPADAGTQSVIVQLPDRNETAGLGVCNASPTAPGPSACGGAEYTVTIAPGWQLIKVPFTLFADISGYGNMNEMMLDTTSLTQVQWQVQLQAADASAVPFDFCVAEVSFY